MALNTKSFRKITIGDTLYYWRVKPDQWMLHLLITKSGDSHHPTLNAFFNQQLEDEGLLIISPNLVQQTFEHGLKHGWTPDIKGPNMHIGDGVNSFIFREKDIYTWPHCTSDCPNCRGTAAA